MRYFVADDGDHGSELYRATGSGPATLVKDIAPGGESADPRDLTADGSLVYFAATDGDNGYELWVTDGTAAGTRPLTAVHGTSSSAVSLLGVVDHTLLFAADDGVHGPELWSSDGTAAHTGLLEDIDAIGSDGSNPGQGVVAGDQLFFTADDGVHGRELWVSDGTAAGTKMAADVDPGPSWSGVSYLTAIGDDVYFSAFDGSTDVKGDLFTSDGTTAGTRLIKDLEPTPNYSSSPRDYVAFNGKVYFSASTQDNGTELYETDGTSAGTQRVLDIRPGSGDGDVSQLTVAGGTLYFVANDGTHGRELWATDGTAGGTHMVDDVNPTGTSDPYSLTPIGGGRLAFGATDGTHGRELWTTDGTTTEQVKDINPDGDGTPSDLLYDGSLLWFQADDGTGGTELWSSDGTAAGTTPRPLNDAAAAAVGQSARLGDRLVTAYGNGPVSLLVSDGTAGGTSVLSPALRSVYGMASLGDKVVFRADDGPDGDELWVTDGTGAGTHIVTDLNPGSAEGAASDPVAAGGKVYFIGQPANPAASELWVTDGTAAGTHAVTDDATLEWPSDLTAFGTQVAFTAYGAHGYVAWVSDGTAAGTHTVDPGGDLETEPGAYGVLGSRLFFTGNDSNYNTVLYVSDGTSAGTHEVGGDFGNGNAEDFTAAGGKLYYAGYDPDHGNQLFVTDGTAAGTHMVKAVGPGGYYQGPKDLTPAGDRLVFTAGGASGVWATDGTAAGTTRIAQRAGEDAAVRGVGSRAFFAAADDAHGVELWSTDGTPAGTGLAADLVGGAGSSRPQVAGEVPGKLVVLGDAPGDGLVAYGVAAPVESQTPPDGDGDGNGHDNPGGGTTTTTVTTTTTTPASTPAAPAAPVKPPVPRTPADARRTATALTLTAATAADGRPPFRYAVAGRLRLPAGLAKAKACAAGTVTVTARRGDDAVARATAKLAKDCTYAVTVTKATYKHLAAHGGKLTLTARFNGNAVLRPARSKGATVRYGGR